MGCEAEEAPGVKMMTQVQRHPTIPMTKRDSLVSNGTRKPLLGNNTSVTTHRKLEDSDFVNTNNNMVAGKKRTPKPVRRTPSYKIATNRLSAYDFVEDDIECRSVEKVPNVIVVARGEERKKYNTLPRAESTLPQTCVKESRGKRHSGSGDSQKVYEIERNASQKSGTYYPSPDTDEDQRSIPPDRKKKSAFKRVKERLILTFKRDRDTNEQRKKPKRDKHTSHSRIKVKPNQSGPRDGFKTPQDGIEYNKHNKDEGRTKEPHTLNADPLRGEPVHATDRGAANKQGGVIWRNGGTSSDDKSQSNKGRGLIQTLRNSFRKNKEPQKTKKYSGTSDSPQSSSQTQSSSSLERGSRGQPNVSQPITIPNEHVRKIEEQFIDADDSITELFGNLIEPDDRSVQRPAQRPDRSKLRLEGLKKFRPRSFERRTNVAHRSDLSPTVEVDGETDGFDYADAPPAADFPEESELEYADVSREEQQRRVDDVARRLAAIGDSIVSRRESESAGSSDDVEGYMVGSQRRLSQFEHDLIRDLREFADDIDGTLFKNGRTIPISSTVLPIIKNIITAQDYSSFRRVIQQEISNTIGWEEVAWYTYLIKTAMYVAGASKTVGGIVRRNATDYFARTFRPWIQSRPNGWESIQEETDVDSELD